MILGLTEVCRRYLLNLSIRARERIGLNVFQTGVNQGEIRWAKLPNLSTGWARKKVRKGGKKKKVFLLSRTGSNITIYMIFE